MDSDTMRLAEFEAYFAVNLSLFLLYSIPAGLIVRKHLTVLDMPTQVNIFLYLVSFLVRATTWGVMLFVYDTGETDSERLQQGSYLFILDYGASFAMKISLMLFIFDMMQVRIMLTAQSHEDNQEGQYYRKKLRCFTLTC